MCRTTTASTTACGSRKSGWTSNSGSTSAHLAPLAGRGRSSDPFNPDSSRSHMLGIHEFWLFIISGLLLNITPGPDTAYIIGRSVQMGWRGGVAAALGIGAGCLVHVAAAAIGLSALLAASSIAFTAVKWLGAAY